MDIDYSIKKDVNINSSKEKNNGSKMEKFVTWLIIVIISFVLKKCDTSLFIYHNKS